MSVPDPGVTVVPCFQYKLYQAAPVTGAHVTVAFPPPPTALEIVGTSGTKKLIEYVAEATAELTIPVFTAIARIVRFVPLFAIAIGEASWKSCDRVEGSVPSSV